MEYEDRRTIATPEGVTLALPLANFGSRFMALLIDCSIGAAALAATAFLTQRLVGDVGPALVAASGLLIFYVGYHVLFEVAGGGRTPGKRAAGLRVVSDGGAPVGLRASLIRNLILLIEGLTLSYAPAIISVLATRDNQRLGDLAAGTLVIRDQKAAAVAGPPAPHVAPEAYASWDVTGVGEDETATVRAFLERRGGLRPSARHALAAQLAGGLRPRVAGVRSGLDDEAFLEHLAAAKARGLTQSGGQSVR